MVFATDTGGLSADRSLQVLALLLDGIWLYFGAVCLRILLGSRRTGLIALALFAFWPGNILFSVQIGNDIALFASMAFSTAFWLKTMQDRRFHTFALAISSLALGLLIKSNAVILIPIFALSYLGIQRGRIFLSARPQKAQAIFAIVVLSLALAIAAERPLTATWKGEQKDLLVGNSSKLGQGMRVPRDLHHLCGWDLVEFFDEPFVDPWIGDERKFFLNYYLKSSLFGEFKWDSVSGREALARTLVAVLAFFLMLTPLGMYRLSTLVRQRATGFIFLSLFFYFLASWIYRIYLPYSCCAHFRFSAPILLSWTPVLATCASPPTAPTSQRHPIRNRVNQLCLITGKLLTLLWCALSMTFFLAPYFF
jgi:hypothetical protein